MLACGVNKTDVALLMADSGRAVRYGELSEWIEASRQLLRGLPRPALAFQFAPNSAGAVGAYLACLAERLPLGLGEPALATWTRVIDAYLPSALILPEHEPAPEQYEIVGGMSGGELRLWRRRSGAYHVTPHRSLALLLATSGSTGDAKFVRLSLANLEANARSIAQYLQLGPSEVAIQSLPMHYSFGLSVLNSHLLAGGTVALTEHSFVRPDFWKVFDACGCTSFAGVPFMYETLHRLRINPTEHPSLRTMTQAGGHLREELARHFHEAAKGRGARFFVMYGQTEATARIAYVPPERLADKLGSIGIAIPEGRLWLEAVDGEPNQHQLFYGGPNVMMGYATGPADLSRGDELGGVLATGDLAECDGDGFYRLTGRLARIAKLFGKRVSLASIEGEIEQAFPVRAAAVDGGDQLRIFLEGEDYADTVRSHLAGLLGVPPLAIKTVNIDRLPMTTSGKKDYKALK
jgi:acyl-CoA synthetase (AMP-forming)/AMP-acid ligase II